MITLDDLKTLNRSDVICIPRPGKLPEKWRVNGAVQTWKRDSSRVRVPVKHGLYAYDALTEDTLGILNAKQAYIEGRDA